MTLSVRLRSLILAVGGEAGLLRILTVFYKRLEEDVLVGFFFEGHDLARIARHQCDLLLKASGLAKNYTGKLPASAHLELPPILTGHFDRRLRVLESVLRAEGLDETQIQTWVGFEEQFRSVIVQSDPNR